YRLAGTLLRRCGPRHRLRWHLSSRLRRRQFLWREIVDRDRRRNCVRGGAKLRRLGVIDQALPARLTGVGDMRPVHAIPQWLRRDGEREGALEARETVVANPMENIGGQPVACRGGSNQQIGAGAREAIGRTAAPRSEWQQHESQQPRARPIGKVREDFIEARLDGSEAALHAPLEGRQVGLLAALVLPALEHGGEEIKL